MLRPHEITALGDPLQVVRRIRNECAAVMTGSTLSIDAAQQERWWETRDPWLRLWLFFDGDDPVGYGLIRRLADGRHIVSGGLTEGARGRGRGSQLFRFLTERLEERNVTPWLDVRADNVAARKTFEGLGYTMSAPETREGIGDVVWMRRGGAPTITVYTPTLGVQRRRVRPLLESIAEQIGDGDQVVVVEDALPREGGWVRDLVHEFGRTAPGAWEHHFHRDRCYGNPQRNWVFDTGRARGELLVANDDDDIFLPGAFDAIRRQAQETPDRVMLFRFEATDGRILWAARELRVGHIGGHCIVVPNRPAQIGRWGRRYAGDFDFITDTVERFGGLDRVVWCDTVISKTRPDRPRLNQGTVFL